MLTSAAILIIVCGNTNREIHKGYWVQDCSAATENMLLAAAEIEIGSVWLGVYPVEERVAGIKNLYQLPEGIEPLNILSFWYPA